MTTRRNQHLNYCNKNYFTADLLADTATRFTASPAEVGGRGPGHDGKEEGLGPFKVLIPISVAGWVLFGASCILCINGKGRAGRWVPEWYLDSDGRQRDKALVVAWWAAVMVLWPVILPVLLVRKLVVRGKKTVKKMRRRREERGGDVEKGGLRRARVTNWLGKERV